MEAVHLDMVALHFSTRCGAACSFCYFSHPSRQRQSPTPLSIIDRVLRKIATEGVREVLFVGGDPVIHPDFFASLEIAKEVGLTTSVLSNSWTIRPEKYFDRTLELIDFCEASILGATAERHDALTQRPYSFQHLLANLIRIGVSGRSIGVCVNVIPENLHEIYSIVKVLSKMRVPVRSLMIQRVIPSGRAKGSFKFGLKLEDVRVLMEQVDRVSEEFGIPILFEDPIPWCTVDRKYHKYLAKCQWGYTRGSINSEGLLNRCGADDHYRLGSVLDRNVQDVWLNHPILRSFRSKQYLAEQCRGCELLEKCGGGCALSCGTLLDHSLDQLYVERIGCDDGGAKRSQDLEGQPPLRTLTRFATKDDLQTIVDLEAAIFAGSSPVFTHVTIGRYFARCPQAFRVTYHNGLLVGYSAIFPITRDGVKQIELEECSSVIYMSERHIGTTFLSGIAAFYWEVIAVKKDGPFAAKFALLKDTLTLLNRYSVPVYGCPVSAEGLRLVRKAGFRVLRPGSRLYVLPAPLVVL